MRRDPVPPDGEEDPLDAALGDLGALDELEQRFALLDAQLAESTAAPGDPSTPAHRQPQDDDDPFSDIARALREHRAAVEGAADADDDSLLNHLVEPGEADLEDEDSELLDDRDDEEDDPVAAEIEERCQEALDALDSDDPATAREIAMAAVRLDDEHPFPMFVLGLVAEREGDLDTARDMAELSLRTAGTNADAIGLRAHIHVRQHELAQAEELLRYGIAHNPDDAALHEGLARVALARGRHDEALRAAGAALRIEPGNPGALAVRTAALEDGADRGALLAALRQGVQLHPEDPYAMVELASVEMEHGNLDRARVLLVRAQRLAPRDQQITDVRALVEHVYERPLLRPVPTLSRWMQDFPGGLAGFLVGFVVAALPLHALAMVEPDYRIPAISVIVAWGLVALYAWLAPAMLTWRLDQRAARATAERVARELRDPLAELPSVERMTDALSMLATARDRRGAAELAELAARRAQARGAQPLASGAQVAIELAPLLAALARRLRSARARAVSAITVVPILPRLLVAIGTLCVLMAPALARATDVSLLGWHAIAAASFGSAWLVVQVDRRSRRRFEESLVAVQLAAAGAADGDA
jgi:tetratricopeptide (TPR) repeat protein